MVSALLGLALQAHAVDLTGVVVDADGHAVPGAVVVVVDRDGPWRRWTTTAADGHWLMPDVPGGRFRVRAQQWGFYKDRVTTRLPYVKREIPIDFVLTPLPDSDPTDVLGLIPVEGTWIAMR